MEDLSKITEYKQLREDKYKQDSKDRLSKILKKKVETTMIGALSSIEEHFSFLWESEDSVYDPKQIYELYQKIRSEILDKGNSQARNIDSELSQYDIKWLKYSVTIPVKNS
jgi:hypothetical protein